MAKRKSIQFKKVDPKLSLYEMQEKVLQFWQENRIFEKSIEMRPADNLYSFYDGPPFITGIPHYGTFLSSIAKDIIPRYQTMKGKRVRRVWGWDCHGLPAETQVEKKLGIKSKREIEELGIGKFIAALWLTKAGMLVRLGLATGAVMLLASVSGMPLLFVTVSSQSAYVTTFAGSGNIPVARWEAALAIIAWLLVLWAGHHVEKSLAKSEVR